MMGSMSLRPIALLLALVLGPAHAGDGGVESSVGAPPMTVSEKLNFSREAVASEQLCTSPHSHRRGGR